MYDVCVCARGVCWFLALCQACLQFVNPAAELFQFSVLMRRWRRLSWQQVADKIKRAGDTFRFRQTGGNSILGFLVEVERVVQIPRQKIVGGLMGGPDDLRQELERQGDSSSLASSTMIWVMMTWVRSLPVRPSTTRTSIPSRTMRAMSFSFT